MKKRDNRVFATTINIVGMGVAFSVFMTLMVRVLWDWTYDRRFQESEKVFVMKHNLFDEGKYWTSCSRPIIEMMKDACPNLTDVGTFWLSYDRICNRTETPENKIKINGVECDSEVFRILHIPILEGSLENFDNGMNAMLSETGAHALFGDESPVGKSISINQKQWTIVGVYKDLPKNGTVNQDLLMNLGKEDIDNTGEWSYHPLLRLEDPDELESTKEAIFSKLSMFISNNTYYYDKKEETDDLTIIKNRIFFRNIHESYYEKNDLMSVSGDKAFTNTLFTIALLIVLISLINFINFSFARIPFRIKSINTRKVLGAGRSSLILREISTAVLVAACGFALAILLLHLLAGTPVAGYVGGSMRIMDNIGLVAGSFGLAIICAVIAGLIPALYATSQPAAIVLKGSYSTSVKGRGLRNILVSLQFVLSFIFTILGLFIGVQIRHLINKDMGFETENIVQVTCGYGSGNRAEAFESKLKQNAGIVDVTFCDGYLLSNGRMSWTRDYDNERMFFEVMPIATDFLTFFGIEVLDGRNFTEADTKNELATMIVNESFVKAFPKISAGSKMGALTNEETDIVGVVKDFNFKSASYPVTPLVLLCWGANGWRSYNMAYVKLAPGNPEDAIKYIKKTVCEFDSNYSESTVEVSFMDESIEYQYKSLISLRKLITIASLVALLIAIIGIIGLVYFETQFISKDIAVRRVNGATVEDILRMINRKYVIISLVSFVISVPLALMVILGWRSSFAYQAPVPVWIFAVTLIGITLLTVAVVTWQSWKAANANPVDSLKNE